MAKLVFMGQVHLQNIEERATFLKRCFSALNPRELTEPLDISSSYVNLSDLTTLCDDKSEKNEDDQLTLQNTGNKTKEVLSKRIETIPEEKNENPTSENQTNDSKSAEGTGDGTTGECIAVESASVPNVGDEETPPPASYRASSIVMLIRALSKLLKR